MLKGKILFLEDFWSTKWKIGGFGVQNRKLEDVLRNGGHLCAMLMIYKSTTFLQCQSTIYQKLGQKPVYKSTRIQQQQKVYSTLNIRRNLQSTFCLPPSPKTKKMKLFVIFFSFLKICDFWGAHCCPLT